VKSPTLERATLEGRRARLFRVSGSGALETVVKLIFGVVLGGSWAPMSAGL